MGGGVPEDMTISKVGASRTFSTQHGEFVSYRIELEGPGEAELVQKPTTPVPEVGQSVFGELVPGKEGFPPKLKKAQQAKGSWSPSKRDPAEVKAIQRQHSQEMALRAVNIALAHGVIPAADLADDSRQFFQIVKDAADYFDKDIANGKAGE
jgi:hypothetical protein